METLFVLGGLAGVAYVLNKSRSSGAPRNEPFTTASTAPSEGGGPDYYNFPQRSTQFQKDFPTENLYTHKQEVPYMGDVAPNQGNPWGNPVRTDFYQSRIIPSDLAQGEKPFQETHQPHGLGYGFDENGRAVQDILQERMRKTDDLRIADKPKVAYTAPVKTGHALVSQPGAHPVEVPKNRPPTAFVQGPAEWLNNGGVGPMAPTEAPNADEIMKPQSRETTEAHLRWGPAVNAISGMQTYIRPVWEPLLTFFKLTAGERFNPAGPASASTNAFPQRDMWGTTKLNEARDTLSVVKAPPMGVVNPDYINAEASGAVHIRKVEGDFLTDHVHNPSRLGQQTAPLDHIGAVTTRPKGEYTVGADRADQSIYDQLKSNPYVNHYNPTGLQES